MVLVALLLIALFVLQRHQRWNSPYPVPGANKRVVELLSLIRQKVEKKELE